MKHWNTQPKVGVAVGLPNWFWIVWDPRFRYWRNALWPRLSTSKHKPITIAKAATLFLEFRNTVEVKNNGSLRNQKPRSVDCCALYSGKTSSLLSLSASRTLVARINLPPCSVAMVIAVYLGTISAWIWKIRVGWESLRGLPRPRCWPYSITSIFACKLMKWQLSVK